MLKELVSKGFKTLTALGTIVTLDSYWNGPQRDQLKELIKSRDSLVKELHAQETSSLHAEIFLKVKIEALNSRLLEEHSRVMTEVEKLKNINPESPSAKTDFKYHLDQFISEADKNNKTFQEIMDIINKRNKFLPSPGGLNDLVASWYEMLSHLSTAQLGALTHLFSSLFILSCLFTIMSVVYGDFLLDYLKLEARFPKLARFIKLRKTFKHFYLFINFMLIIITLIALIAVNCKILFY